MNQNNTEVFLKNIPPQITEHDIIDAIQLNLGADCIKESFVTQRHQIQNSGKSLKITFQTPVQASELELIPPGPGNLIVSGRPLNNFSSSEDVYKVFSLFGKLSNALLKNIKSQEKIIFLEFVNKESAKQAIADLNEKPLPPELIRRLKLQTMKKDAERPDAHYYLETDFIGGEEFNIEKVYQLDPSVTKDTLKVGYISDKQQQPHPTQTQSYEDNYQNEHKFLPILHIIGLTPIYDEAYLKEKIENITGEDTIQFVKIDNREKSDHSFRKARVTMKRREDGDKIIERQSELQALRVEWFVPPPDRNVGSGENSHQYSYAPPLFTTPPPQQRIRNAFIHQQQIQYPIQSSILQIIPSVNPPLPPNQITISVEQLNSGTWNQQQKFAQSHQINNDSSSSSSSIVYQEKQQRAVSLPPPQQRRHKVGSNTHSKQYSYIPPLFPTPPPQQRINNIFIHQQQIQYPIQSSILQIFPSVNPPLPPNQTSNQTVSSTISPIHSQDSVQYTQKQVQQQDDSVDQWQIRVNWEDDGPNEDILRQEFAPFKAVNVILDPMEPTDNKRSAI
ncbi:MAG: hypothetical protein EZS28_039832, partial [Streblomastix strix]